MTAATPPAEPRPPGLRDRWARHGAAVLAGVGFLLWATVLLLPALVGGEYCLPGTGSQDSDVIRGAWSLGQAASGLPDPIWTERVFFPVGIKVVPLPFGSGVLLAPAQLLLGPLRAYDVSIVALLAAAGFSTAWLGREIGGSWGIGALAGGGLLAQPMLMHSISDGTPEHLAMWSLPAVLAAAWRAQRTGQLRWAPISGILLLVLLLDSPYMAVYGLVVAPFFLVGTLMLRPAATTTLWRRLRPLLLCGLCAIPAVLVVGLLYRDFTLAPQDFTPQAAAVELAGNSVVLRSWWGLEVNPGSDHRGNLVPALIPSIMLVPTVLLALLGPRRSLPWLLAGGLMMALAMGTNGDNLTMLGWWLSSALGPTGQSLGDGVGRAILDLNTGLLGHAPFSGIRFPRRWLVPAALCLSLAGSMGLRSLLGLGLRSAGIRRLVAAHRVLLEALGIATGLGLATALLFAQPYLHPRATTDFPSLDFASWIEDQDGPGAVIAFPTVRPGRPNTHRWELPVYANISDTLRSADSLYFQLVHRRPIYSYPALFTATALGEVDERAIRLVRDTNDMAMPGMIDKEPPSSAWATDDNDQRAGGRAWLVERGLRFVVLDLSVYDGVWLERAVTFYEPLASEQRFDDGDGVLVLELEL